MSTIVGKPAEIKLELKNN